MKNTKTDQEKMLLIAIGNCGRNDDGIGWKFAEMICQNDDHFLDCEYRYQLQVEDAILAGNYNTVFFVDASHEEIPNGFAINFCSSAEHYFYSSHLQAPETILYLAKELYSKMPQAYTIAISGHNWGLGTSLSRKAKKNLQSAYEYFIKDFLPNIHRTAPDLNEILR